MLLGTVLLWALNITFTRYIVTHDFKPLAYATTRYFAATALFWVFTYARERTFRVRLSDKWLIVIAGVLIFANQIGFVYSLRLTSASTVALILGSTPVFVGIIASLIGLERLPRMGIGAVLVILGIIVLIIWNVWIGIILIILGLLFGGFRRGSWY